uniref:Zinc finger CCHC-type containing 14 n=1 Tax=Naja naja TaxID=35670 RepID=A0A8C7E7E0_NAJNA
MVEKRCPRLQRESVYRWFSELPSPQRVEFLCGLLDLCIPLELRFLGACLEDLARKDYHSLRDSEIKANNAADLGGLTNLTDEVVRSKLLVSLALLGSSHREAAGVLFRTLTHLDSVIHNYGLQLNEGRTGDEFLLLFTMASNHPAFSFHQKQVLRQELTKIQSLLACTAKGPPAANAAPGTAAAAATCPGCHKVTPRSETPINHVVGNSLENALHTSAHSMEESLSKRPSGKHSKVSVEKVELKGLSHKKNDRIAEYSFEVLWSDSSVTVVTKSSAEVTDFISKLGQLCPEENLEKFIPFLAGPDSFYLERSHMDLESDLRYLASLPSHIWKNDHVKKFFSTSCHSPQYQSSSPGNSSLYKVGTTLGASGRPVCGVAGVQAAQNSLQHHLPHPSAAAVALSHCSHSGGAGPTLACSRSQMDNPSPVLMPPSPQNPQAQEQNGIFNWLRKLRLHKYYPVFKQLTMEKFLRLTEEDLNKFETLTMGAKKKLKTQLELENREKSEKQTMNPAPSPSVSSGVARVPPTTHINPIQNIRGNHATELHVDVDQTVSTMPPREGSSSESSSSSSSPMGLQPREESSDSAEENERRVEIHPEPPEKEKPIMILNHFGSSSARPTAQVLPVQNEAGSSLTAHHPLPGQMTAAPIRILNSMHKPERGNADLKLLSSPMHSLLPLEDRTKFSGGPTQNSIKMEKSFGNALADRIPAPPHQPLQVLSAVPENGPSRAFHPFRPPLQIGPCARTGPNGETVPGPGHPGGNQHHGHRHLQHGLPYGTPPHQAAGLLVCAHRCRPGGAAVLLQQYAIQRLPSNNQPSDGSVHRQHQSGLFRHERHAGGPHAQQHLLRKQQPRRVFQQPPGHLLCQHGQPAQLPPSQLQPHPVLGCGEQLLWRGRLRREHARPQPEQPPSPPPPPAAAASADARLHGLQFLRLQRELRLQRHDCELHELLPAPLFRAVHVYVPLPALQPSVQQRLRQPPAVQQQLRLPHGPLSVWRRPHARLPHERTVCLCGAPHAKLHGRHRRGVPGPGDGEQQQ